MKELVSGELCYAGQNKVERIWLGQFKGVHVCVLEGSEDDFKSGRLFAIASWETCIPIPDEPVYEYQWMLNGDIVVDLTFYTEEEIYYAQDRYTKILATKRVRK